MTMNRNTRTIAAAAMLIAAPFTVSRAADFSETFDSWSSIPTFGSFTNDNWIAQAVAVKTTNFPTLGDGTPWLQNTNSPFLQTPLLTNGFGTVSFNFANNGSGTYPFTLEVSTNGSAPWTVVASHTNSLASQVWTNRSFVTNIYEDVFLRIAGGKPSGTIYLGIENFRVTEAPARVTISDLYTDPPLVYVNDEPALYATLTPSALASNITASVITTAGAQSATNAMTNTVGNLWRAVLPARTVPSTVSYTVNAMFDGTNALSPATASSAYTVIGIPFSTDYAANSMIVTGDFNTGMTLIAPYQWQGILSLPQATSLAHFQFQGIHTNGGYTNTWGDAAPASTSLIAYGTATTGAASIAAGPLPAGQIAVFFNEQTRAYGINDVRFNNFDAWSDAGDIGTHESNDWIVTAGQVAGDDRTRGLSVILSTNEGAGVRSPEHPGGIGTISFWQRHGGDDDRLTLSSCEVQVSISGGDTPGEWVTVATISVDSKEFRREEIPFNSRHYRYARLVRTGEPVEVLADEFMVASPGAGISMAGLTHTPASPDVDDEVMISAELTAFRGAVLTNVTAWWRTAGTNDFTGIAMSKGTGDVWSTISGVPRAQGNAPDGLGAGDVEYYIHADFSGYQAQYGSPAFLPVQGAAAPDLFSIQPSYLLFTNVVHTPSRPAINTGFAVSADIVPMAGAQPANLVIYYRAATTGEYTTVLMSTTGSHHYASVRTIPVPAHPGSPVQYYIRATYTGPSAQSPAFYPPDGPGNPVTVLAGPAPMSSEYSSMSATGTLAGGLRLIGNRQWRGILSLPAPVSNPSFRIRGTGAVTNIWGDNSASATNIPIFSTAITGQAPVTLSGTWSNDFILVFNETNRLYSLRRVYLANFSGFTPSDTFSPGATVTNNGWTILNATVFNTNAAFDGNTLRLGGADAAGTNSHVQSPVISGGIGSIGFWYRNLDETGSRPGHLDVRVRSAALPQWKTIGSLTNILSADYLFHEVLYASTASNIEVRLQWNSSNNPSGAQLAVDDLTIERISASTAISNIIHTPLSPSFTNSVSISANITPTNAATLTAAVWYRIGTSGTFTATAMTNTGGNTWVTDPSLPRTEPGTVQYYIQTEFTSPHGDGPFTLTGPVAGPDAPLAFTNSDALAALTEVTTAEGWIGAPVSSSRTNTAGWIRNDGFVKGRTFTALGVAAIWLDDTKLETSWLQTPWLPFGVGAVHMENTLNTAGSAVLDILASANGTDWTAVHTMDITNSVWRWNTIPLNIEQGLFLRFAYHEATLQKIGLDNINITYPLASVAVTNVSFHPYYPSGTDPVHIRCGINSASSFSPAIDITARVYYKNSSVTNWSGPIEMTRDGSSYITATPIPAFASGSTVHYYIESTFKGYQSFYSYSPTTEPANPDMSPYSYSTRSYASSYETIRAVAGDQSIGMNLIGNTFWEGMLEFITPYNNPYFQIEGYGFYSGTNVGEGLSVTWGDDNVFRTNLPLSGSAQPYGSPILIPELAQGQYVLRFDESSRTYTLQRLAFQNFNTWPASDVNFEESYAAAEIKQYLQDFNGWSLSDPNPMTDVFEEGWTSPQQYPYTNAFPAELEGQTPAGFFKLYDGVVITQIVGSAAMLTDIPLSGQIVAVEPDSAGEFSFDARAAGQTNFTPAIYSDANFTDVRITATIQAFDLPTNTPSATVSNSFGRTYKSLIGGYLDANNFYEVRLRQISLTQKIFELVRRINGTTTTIATGSGINGMTSANDTFSLHIFRNSATNVQLRVYVGGTAAAGLNATYNAPLITNGFGIGVAGMDAGVSLGSVSVFGITNITDTSTTNELYTENFTGGASGWSDAGGLWTVTNNTFRRAGYTGPPLSLDVDYSLNRVDWTTVASFTNINHSFYQRFSASPHQAASGFMRIRHKGGAGNLVIDNIRSEVWRGATISSNNWTAFNAWVTAGKSGNGLELRGSRMLSGEQLIQSPVISNGVAVIAFDYKSVPGTSNTLIIALDYTHTNAPANWIPYLAITNNPADWVNYAHSIDRELRPQIYRMRIRNASTNAAAGILLDNIAITEPAPINDFTWWGYNVLVTGKQTNAPSRLAPIAGNIKGAYLNNAISNAPSDGTQGTAGISYTSYYPFVQSAYLPDGVGEISFWYRAWNSTPSTIEIVTATNRYLPEPQWTVLTNVPVANTTFTYFSRYFHDTDSRYVKLRVNTSVGTPGRVAIDDLRISAPFASDLRLSNLRLIPEIPRFSDSVFVSVQADQFFFNPLINSMRLFFKAGTNQWGDHSGSAVYNMALVDADDGVLTYQTLDAIPPTAVDSVVQYQVEVAFDGFFSQYSSPKRYTSFANPYHYWPVDLNRDQPLRTPYYFSFSSLPGQVWINEFNIADFSTWQNYPAGQFIEIAGKGNVSLSKWRMDIINPDFTTNATYAFTNGTVIGSASNAYGYIVFGQSDITGRDRSLTNDLPYSGGIQLVRSMGAIDQQVSYDDWFGTGGYQMSLSPDHRFVYAGVDDDYFDAAMTLIGTGSNMTNFVWWAPTDEDNDMPLSIGESNYRQTLIPWPDTSPDPEDERYTGTAYIDRAWRSGTQVIMEVSTQSENLTPVPWYATNLVNVTWFPVPSPSWSRTGTLYNVSFPAITNTPRVFYAITVTGTN